MNFQIIVTPCALAWTNGRSHSFVLEFSLLLSLLQGKESKVIQGRFDTEVDYLLWSFDLNRSDSDMLPIKNDTLCSFCLDAKRTKKIKPGPKRRRPGRPTHMNSHQSL
jgi:hypothetical protein